MKIEVISSNWQRSKKDCQASDNFLTLITQRRFQLNRFIGDLEKRPCGFRFLLRANWHVRLTARYNRLYYKLYFSHYSKSHLKYSTSEYLGLILAYKVYVAVCGPNVCRKKNVKFWIGCWINPREPCYLFKKGLKAFQMDLSFRLHTQSSRSG